jgi:hypothetical protein
MRKDAHPNPEALAMRRCEERTGRCECYEKAIALRRAPGKRIRRRLCEESYAAAIREIINWKVWGKS